MTILESQSIDVMESASVVNSNADSSENGQKQRVTLLGSFTSVLQALQLVESQLPGALAEELKMVRTTPTDICRWEVEFRFNGVAH